MKVKKIIKKEIVVIGAGASGLMVCTQNSDKEFALLEANAVIGQKIKVSGGGKCNITNKNISADRYFGDKEFIKKVIKRFSYRELLDFFEGVEFVKRKDEQFFCKRSSKDILDFFYKKLDRRKIFLTCKVLDVEFVKERFVITTTKGIFSSKVLVVASGGVSFPDLGASDIAFFIAKKFGHKITKTKPALVGLTLQKDDFWMKSLSGVSLPAKIKVANKEFFGDLLFTHKGISGPVVLNSSLYWEKGSIEIDFLAGKKLSLKQKQKQITSNIDLPKRFLKEFLISQGLKDKVVSALTYHEKEKLNMLKSYTLAPAGDFGYKRAEVTKGGIKTDEIDPKTMQSKLQKGLYFLGECLDVTGELGGFNFHFAFSSGKIKL